MHIQILTLGTPRQDFVKAGLVEFTKRLSRFGKIKMMHLKEHAVPEEISRHAARTTLVLLDEKGSEYTSKGFAKYLDRKNSSGAHLTFLIGGTDGHTDEMRLLAHESLSLSRLTLPHEMALLFFTETLYRSLSITAGHPYHRE
jgi:23S rRNA (pseudouridine1915-N3)-methyltransferase